MPHLTYIGDADIGAGTNLGASTITANYDGYRKHRTTIGDRVKTSVDTTLIAPVTVGDEAYTAAGSVIGDDVPPGALGVARSRQKNIDGYAERRPRARRGRGSRRRAQQMNPTTESLLTSTEPSGAGRRLADTLGVVETRTAPTAMSVGYDKRLMLVTGRANPELAAKIASKLGVELSEVTTKTFSNGEVYCRYRESVRGADVFIVQPICGNPATGRQPPMTR